MPDHGAVAPEHLNAAGRHAVITEQLDGFGVAMATLNERLATIDANLLAMRSEIVELTNATQALNDKVDALVAKVGEVASNLAINLTDLQTRLDAALANDVSDAEAKTQLTALVTELQDAQTAAVASLQEIGTKVDTSTSAVDALDEPSGPPA